MKEFRRLMAGRASVAGKLILGIAFDGLVLAVWLLVAWGLFELAEFVESNGVNEVFAEIFKWASSGSTLVLALSYVVADILLEWKRLWKEIRE